MFHKSKPEDRCKVEAKMCLAQDDPEPIFDLSTCNLNKVPRGVFIRCKILRKTHLLLHDNCLTKLMDGGNMSDLVEIEMLDLHNNLFQKLSDDFCILHNLKILNLAYNKLTKLPSNFGNLTNLEQLFLQKNCIKQLPESFYTLQKLRSLDLSFNKLTDLRPEICKLRSLKDFKVEGNKIDNLPPDILLNEFSSVISYFGGEQMVPQGSPTIKCSQSCSFSHMDSHEERLKQMKNIEKDIDLQSKLEIELNSTGQANREKLFSYLKIENEALDRKLKSFKSEQDDKKKKLYENLIKAEEEVSQLINRLMMTHSECKEDDQQSSHSNIVQKFKRLLSIKNRKTCQKQPLEPIDVYSDMYKLLIAESQQRCKQTLNEIQSCEHENDELFSQFCNKKIVADKEMLSQIQENESLQKEAVTLLYVKGDKRREELLKGQAEIKEELMRLTDIELQFKKDQSDIKLAVVQEQCRTLTALFEKLTQQQSQREQIIRDSLSAIHEAEGGQVSWVDHFTFLSDYCKLESLPQDEAIAHILQEEGLIEIASEFLISYRSITVAEFLVDGNDILQRLGVDDEEIRTLIMKKLLLLDPTPSAPPLKDPYQPSAPMEDDTEVSMDEECIICFSRQRMIVFVPCGHLCSCATCASSLHICPVCRADITNFVKIINV